MSTMLKDDHHDHIELLIIPEHGAVYSNHPMQSNEVTTTKYTWYNFFPLNLWHQLTTLANAYFILIGVLQMLKWTTTSGGIPTMYTPLTTITIISGCRAAFENISAYKSDTKRNKALFWQLSSKVPNYFNNVISDLKNSSGQQSARPLLSNDGTSDNLSQHNAIASHPSMLFHAFQNLYFQLSKKLRNRWYAWVTNDPTTVVHLPGLTLTPHQANSAYDALKPQDESFFGGLFSAKSRQFIQPQPQRQQSLSPVDLMQPTGSILSSDGLLSPSSPSFSASPVDNTPFSRPDTDQTINNAIQQRRTLLSDNESFQLVHSGAIKTGSILKIYKNQMIPCDLILLGTSELRNHCFIDKANLNGETQLEVMNGIPQLKQFFSHKNPLTHSHGSNIGVLDTLQSIPFYDVDFQLQYDLPNPDFEQFRCQMSIYSHARPDQQPITIPLSSKQLLLRETVLRNSEYIYGLVVYTGDDTKIRRSIVEEQSGSTTSNIKTSQLLKAINTLVMILFFVQLSMCVFAGIWYAIWVYSVGSRHWYLNLDASLIETLFGALASSGSWLILVNSFVPISLLVSAEMTRFYTTLVIERDLNMYDNNIQRPAKCNTSTVHDDLGTIDVIFSDKTGTLTQNKMELRYLSVAVHTARDKHEVIDLNNYNLIKSSQPLPGYDKNALKLNEKASLTKHINHYIRPLQATSAFEAFGSLMTEIAVKVKQSKGGGTKKGLSILKSHLFTKDGELLRYFQLNALHPYAYQPLPPRWTSTLLEQGLIEPMRPVIKTKKNQVQESVPAVIKARLMKLPFLTRNAALHGNPFYDKHNSSTHTPVTKASYSIFSHLWNTAQGHAYYQWCLALSRVYYIKKHMDKLDKQHALTQHKAGQNLFISANLSKPTPFDTNLNGLQTNPNDKVLFSQYGNKNVSTQSVDDEYDSQDQHGIINSQASFHPSQTAPSGTHHEMDLFSDNINPLNQSSVDFLLAQDENDEPPLLSTFNVSSVLHSPIGVAATLSSQNSNSSAPATSVSEMSDSALSHANTIIFPSKSSSSTSTSSPQPPTHPMAIYNRLLFEKDYYLPVSQLLGSFRLDSRTAILTALWSKNWAHRSTTEVFVAPLNIRIHLYRYIRSLALSSTVKAYRKPDGTIDYQFESAEEYSMARFAYSLGFYRDVHPSGEGICLYVREFFTPDFEIRDIADQFATLQSAMSSGTTTQSDDEEFTLLKKKKTHQPMSAGMIQQTANSLIDKFSSKIHSECYNNLGVCGFSSARARVTIILQRNPQVTMPLFGQSTPNPQGILYNFDTDQCLEGSNTHNEYSTYLSEYDRDFRDQTQVNIAVHPHDENNQNNILDDLDGLCTPTNSNGQKDSRGPSPGIGKKYIHVLTKGQDATTIPLISDTIPIQAQSDFHMSLTVSQSMPMMSAFLNAMNNDDPCVSQIGYDNAHHSLKQQLHEMEKSSLRCLVCAYAELPNQWWAQFEKLYSFVFDLDVDSILPVQDLNDVMNLLHNNPNVNPNELSISNLTPTTPSSPKTQNLEVKGLKAVEIRHLTFQAIEANASLSLLGCFGMEDKLQPLVPETIRDLRRAGIRVWMITGDKLDVAKNIALACELIDADMLGTTKSTNNSMRLQQTLIPNAGNSLATSFADYSDFARNNSNLFLTSPASSPQDIFPLCVLQYPSSRLINVTGEWLLNFKQNRDKLMSSVFTAITEHDENRFVLVEISFLQQCLLHLGMDLSLTQLGSLFVLEPADIEKYINKVNSSTTIDRSRFVQALNLIGESISEKESILVDIEDGLNTYQGLSNKYNGDLALMPAVSLLVNRNSFNIMFQPDDPAGAKVYAVSTTAPTSPASDLPSTPSPTPSKDSKKDDKKSKDDSLPWLAKKFFVLSFLAKSVVFARAEPAMKKKMVTATRELFPDVMTLAIGDGANDTDMITASHVGIGIAGVEGTAASNSADYAVGTFRMLHRLLLVHGLTYPRLEKIVLLMFYKGAMVAFSHLLFGFHSSFNGSQLFLDILYQMYNIIYTSWAVLLLIQHQPLPTTVYENSPALYREMKSNGFTLGRFAYWLMKALLHSLVIFYVPFMPLLAEGNDIIGGPALTMDATGYFLGQRGRNWSQDHVSTLQLHALAILPNIMAFFLMESIQLPFFLITVISALSIFGTFFVASFFRFATFTLWRSVGTLYLDPHFWLMLILIIAIPLIIEYTSRYVYTHWTNTPGLVQILSERIYLKQKQVDALKKQIPEPVFDDTGVYHNHPIANAMQTGIDINNPHQAQQLYASTNANLHNSLAQSTSNTDFSKFSDRSAQKFCINKLAWDDVASTPENAILDPVDVQLKGCDPDPDALHSSILFGEAAGYGVRASQVDEMVLSNTFFAPYDKMNKLTHQAEALLKTLQLKDPNDIFVPPGLPLEYHTNPQATSSLAVAEKGAVFFAESDALSRLTALRVFRLFSLLTQNADTDSKAQSKAALQQQQRKNKRLPEPQNANAPGAVAYYKRDRFQSVAQRDEPHLSSNPLTSSTGEMNDPTSNFSFMNENPTTSTSKRTTTNNSTSNLAASLPFTPPLQQEHDQNDDYEIYSQGPELDDPNLPVTISASRLKPTPSTQTSSDTVSKTISKGKKGKK